MMIMQQPFRRFGRDVSRRTNENCARPVMPPAPWETWMKRPQGDFLSASSGLRPYRARVS